MNEVSTIERSGKTLATQKPSYMIESEIEAQGDNGIPCNSPLVPNDSGLLPGMDDPNAMKQLLEDEDVERYLRLQGCGK